MATSHDTEGYCRHRADNKCLVQGKDSETQVKPFYDFERRKELDDRVIIEEYCYTIEKKLSTNQENNNDTNVIFGGASVRILRISHKTRIHPELYKYYDAVRISIASNSKYPWIVSSRGASLHPGTHVTITFVYIYLSARLSFLTMKSIIIIQ
jgi:hypothetical protein